ncbi:ATP-binding protein [Nonomuraea aridisoli]|uniref:ATP-binding protein n=1 Tax=Nonomuraea aridisoli TaxID=2070368 RepID=A0A2W2E770_9ACTN|nr:ATP-binding protein [Nonomuraea aridisoli]PZG18241.1 ATP-binding protein [Nonomuraea aridisoli]
MSSDQACTPCRLDQCWILPAEPRSVALARRLTRTTLAAWGVTPPTIDDATLVVSELVTNAISHALPPVTFSLGRTPGGLRGEITDRGPHTTLAPRSSGSLAACGRGLNLVDDLTDQWDVGWSPECGRKTVWFEMTITA